MKRPLDVLAAIGLALGGVFGMAGAFTTQSNLRDIFWAIDGVGVVVAAALLSVRFFKAGKDCVAAGFLVFAIGEGVMLSGTVAGLQASIPAFAAGVALWSAGLLLISFPVAFAIWVRVVGVVAAILFAITAAQIFWGEQITPIARPLPSFAYPFLVLTFAGWIWTVLRAE